MSNLPPLLIPLYIATAVLLILQSFIKDANRTPHPAKARAVMTNVATLILTISCLFIWAPIASQTPSNLHIVLTVAIFSYAFAVLTAFINWMGTLLTLNNINKNADDLEHVIADIDPATGLLQNYTWAGHCRVSFRRIFKALSVAPIGIATLIHITTAIICIT